MSNGTKAEEVSPQEPWRPAEWWVAYNAAASKITCCALIDIETPVARLERLCHYVYTLLRYMCCARVPLNSDRRCREKERESTIIIRRLCCSFRQAMCINCTLIVFAHVLPIVPVHIYIYIYATKWYSWAALALIYNSLNEQQYAWNLPNICIRIFIMLKLFCHRYERPFTCAAPYSQTEHSNECYDRFDLITPKILAWGKATINIQICNIFVKMYMWQNRTGTI